MNTLNYQYNQDALELFNKMAHVAVNNSLKLWEKNFDLVKKNSDRSIANFNTLQTLNTPEEVIAFQREAGATELSELQKAGEFYYEFADSVSQELLSTAEQSRKVVENTFGEAVQNFSSIMPNDKANAFSGAVQESVKNMVDLFQSGIDSAVQVARVNAASVAKGQQAVVDAQLVKATKRTKPAKK